MLYIGMFCNGFLFVVLLEWKPPKNTGIAHLCIPRPWNSAYQVVGTDQIYSESE